jgi:hypothetical protein
MRVTGSATNLGARWKVSTDDRHRGGAPMSRARSSTSTTAAFAAAFGLVATMGATASAAVPSNDDRGSATVVADLPFTDSLDTTDATAQENDPDCFDIGTSPTVWYSFTPANDGPFIATTAGSGYDTTLTLATPGPHGLEIIDCSDDMDDATSRVGWHADVGAEYLLMVGGFDGDHGSLEFAIRRAPPPPSFTLRIARSGSVTRRGAVEIRGFLGCEGTQERQWLFVSGRQDFGRRKITAGSERRVACDQPWTIRVRDEEFRFAAGELIVRAAVEWCNDFDCTAENVRRVVRIR